MAILLKVNWIDRLETRESHHRITHIGGVSGYLHWRHSQRQAVDAIEHGLFTYYIEGQPHAIRLDVAQTAAGDKYLSTEAGDHDAQLLLDLPQFPASALKAP